MLTYQCQLCIYMNIHNQVYMFNEVQNEQTIWNHLLSSSVCSSLLFFSTCLCISCLVAGGMMNKTLQELIQFRQELYEEAWQIHLKLQTIEKTNLSYQELIAEKNRVESNIGHLTTIIMKMMGDKWEPEVCIFWLWFQTSCVMHTANCSTPEKAQKDGQKDKWIVRIYHGLISKSIWQNTSHIWLFTFKKLTWSCDDYTRANQKIHGWTGLVNNRTVQTDQHLSWNIASHLGWNQETNQCTTAEHHQQDAETLPTRKTLGNIPQHNDCPHSQPRITTWNFQRTFAGTHSRQQ